VGLLDVFGKKDVSDELTKKIPYSIKMTFHPLRMIANKSDSMRMSLKVANRSTEPLLTSIVIQVPKKIGLDQTCLSSVREIRLGELPPGEEKELSVDIYGSTRTDEGSYPVAVTAIAHYRNYAYVLNSEKKTGAVRVIPNER